MNATIHTTTDNFEATIARLLESIDPNNAAPARDELVICSDGAMVRASIDTARAFCKPRVETRRRASFVSLLGEEVL